MPGKTRAAIEEWLLSQLFEAYYDARKHKRHTKDESTFETNEVENIMRLRDDIMDRRYKPSRGVAFIINDPVQREIFAAPFRDRVVHHFLYNMVYDWWDHRFIYDSYSCREGKGNLLGVMRLQHHIRKVLNTGHKEAYVIKLDLQGYFMSLPRQKVFERVCWGLDRQFTKPEEGWLKSLLKYLWGEVIFDDPIRDVKIRGSDLDWEGLPLNKSLFNQPPGRGIVIGNLSSQLISNIYLDLLDRFITFDLGYKHYGRYVDDFFIVVPEGQLKQAMKDLEKIKDFLFSLQLQLHPKKQYIQNVRHGVEFLGYLVYPTAIYPAKRMKRNFYKAMLKFPERENGEESITSYLGYMKHVKGKKFCKELFDKFGGEYRF